MANDYSSTTSQLFSAAAAALSRAAQSASYINRPGVTVTTPSFSYVENTPDLAYSANVPGLNYAPGNISLGEMPRFSDMLDGADDSNALISELNQTVDQWFGQHFPAINGAFKTLPEDWCANIIAGTKPFGTDSTIFEMVWHQARDRAYRTSASEQRQLEASFSSRGFSLPTGALVDAIAQSEQRATSAVLDVSRDQAIKDADIKADLLKHATSIASQLKLGILSASADYFRAIYAVHGTAIEKARIKAQLYNTYYNALASYSNVEVTVEGLRLRAAEAELNAAIAGEELKLRAAQASAGIGVEGEQLKLRAAETKANLQSELNRVRAAIYSGDTAAPAHAQAARGFAEAAGSAYSATGTLSAQITST